MKTMNFNTLLKLAAAIGFLGLPASSGATAPAASGGSLAAGLAVTYEETAAAPAKSPRLPGLSLESGGYSEDQLKVETEEKAPRAKRTSRLQEPGEAMGGGKEIKEAAAKKAAGGDKE